MIANSIAEIDGGTFLGGAGGSAGFGGIGGYGGAGGIGGQAGIGGQGGWNSWFGRGNNGNSGSYGYYGRPGFGGVNGSAGSYGSGGYQMAFDASTITFVGTNFSEWGIARGVHVQGTLEDGENLNANVEMYNGATINFASPTPEPASIGAIGVGLVAFLRRRKRP